MVLISSFLWAKTRQNNRINTCYIFSLGGQSGNEEEEIFSFTENVEETEARAVEWLLSTQCGLLIQIRGGLSSGALVS